MAICGECLSAIWFAANIISHRDRKFDSHFWRAVFKILDTMLNLSTADHPPADHPQTDGQIECVNQVLEDMLRAYVSKAQSNWEDYLSLLITSYSGVG